VGNQELPIGVDDHGEAIYTNMDSEWRRIFFNDLNGGVELAPDAFIIYQSVEMLDLSTATEDVVLIGSARDLDNLGEGDDIQEAKWKEDLQGLEWNERTWKFPPGDLNAGHHQFMFQAKDNEGNWSKTDTVSIWVAEKFYNIYLPTVTR